MYSAKELAIARLIKPDIEVAQLDVTDLAILQLVRKATGGGSGVYNATIENGIATFGGVVASQPLVSLKLNIPVTQTGSGTPAPTNIRDFVGVSGANVSRTGKNLYYSADIENETTRVSREVNLPIGTYTLSANVVSDDTDYDDCMIYDGTNAVKLGYIERGSGKSLTFTTDKPIKRLYFYASRTSIQGVIFSFTNIQIELGSTATPYEPYTGNTYTISFGQTVYSAILNVLTGKLSITHELKTIDDNSDIIMSTTGTGIFILDDFFEIEEDTESINSNLYQRAENRSSVTGVINNNPDYSFCCKLGTNADRIMIKDTRFTTIEDYKTWLSTNPVKIAVKLATPIEIQLTPTVINTLIGENVIFADVANVTECKFTRK